MRLVIKLWNLFWITAYLYASVPRKSLQDYLKNNQTKRDMSAEQEKKRKTQPTFLWTFLWNEADEPLKYARVDTILTL